MFPQVMLDLETLSAEPNAPIVQVGAVAFNIRTGEIGPSLKINVRPDFEKTPPSLSTVRWWITKEEDARQSLGASIDTGLLPATMCAELTNWLNANAEIDFELWAMPPEFDVVILANTFRSVDWPLLPWRYNRTRCLRTLEALAGCGPQDRVKAIVKHDAAADAIAQAKTAIKYWHKVLLGGHAMEQG